jgi:hypothetical protein
VTSSPDYKSSASDAKRTIAYENMRFRDIDSESAL